MPDFDLSLISTENLDRLSPDLWSESMTGISGFHHIQTDSEPYQSVISEKLSGKEDLDLIRYLSQLNRYEFVIELKKLYDQSYHLGLDEAKEMTRGKYLNILPTK